jgi:hypothetical protein
MSFRHGSPIPLEIMAAVFTPLISSKSRRQERPLIPRSNRIRARIFHTVQKRKI